MIIIDNYITSRLLLIRKYYY